MTSMPELSLAAQAVLDAFTEDNSLHDWKHNHYNIDALVAALRAAADHVDHDWSGFNCVETLCEIAAELEAQ